MFFNPQLWCDFDKSIPLKNLTFNSSAVFTDICSYPEVFIHKLPLARLGPGYRHQLHISRTGRRASASTQRPVSSFCLFLLFSSSLCPPFLLSLYHLLFLFPAPSSLSCCYPFPSPLSLLPPSCLPSLPFHLRVFLFPFVSSSLTLFPQLISISKTNVSLSSIEDRAQSYCSRVFAALKKEGWKERRKDGCMDGRRDGGKEEKR